MLFPARVLFENELMGNMEERSAEVIVVESVEKNEVEKSSNVSTYRQQKAASSGLGFLLQQMRASATASSTVMTNQEEVLNLKFL